MGGAITTLLKSGLSSNNDWSGTGILAGTPTITNSLATRAIGVMSSAQWTAVHNTPTAFGGYAVQSGDVLLRYTYMGDANLDGVVTNADYTQIDAGYLGAATPSWFNGDFNYDGVVNYLDYALIDAAYAVHGGSLADEMISLHSQEFGAAYTDALGAIGGLEVPEPASVTLVGCGAAGLLLLRRRK